VSFSVKEYKSRWVLLQSGEHNRTSHDTSKGVLNLKQRNGIVCDVRSTPRTTGSDVQANVGNFEDESPLSSDARHVKAMSRLDSKTRCNMMADRVPGISLDGSDGRRLAFRESLPLAKIKSHIKCDVPFMNICTPHFVLKLAPADNRGWPRQMQMGHEVFVHISSPISHHSFLTRLPQASSGQSAEHVLVDVPDLVSDAHSSVVQSSSALVECEPAESARPPQTVRVERVSTLTFYSYDYTSFTFRRMRRRVNVMSLCLWMFMTRCQMRYRPPPITADGRGRSRCATRYLHLYLRI
jgi:hypothetical protein